MKEFLEFLIEMNVNEMWFNWIELWCFDFYLYGLIIIVEYKLRVEYFKKLKIFVFLIDF